MLSAIPYNNNDIYLHTDEAMMPVSVSVRQTLGAWLLHRLSGGPTGQPSALMLLCACIVVTVLCLSGQSLCCIVLC